MNIPSFPFVRPYLMHPPVIEHMPGHSIPIRKNIARAESTNNMHPLSWWHKRKRFNTSYLITQQSGRMLQIRSHVHNKHHQLTSEQIDFKRLVRSWSGEEFSRVEIKITLTKITSFQHSSLSGKLKTSKERLVKL